MLLAGRAHTLNDVWARQWRVAVTGGSGESLGRSGGGAGGWGAFTNPPQRRLGVR